MPFKTKHPLYGIWMGMRNRCRTPTAKAWPAYGGRGISICERWNSFQNFADDMGERPDGMSLERIDNDGNYEPGNCRWATKKDQLRNQRWTRFVVIEGVRYKASDLADLSGHKADTIVVRADKGMSYEEVMSPERYPFMGGWKKAVAKRIANQAAATHCKRGHEWTPENTGIQTGGRFCRACDNFRARLKNAGKPLT